MHNLPSTKAFFDQLFESVRNLVRQNQNPQGYIDTQNEEAATIYGFFYDERVMERVEVRVHAIRINPKTGDLEALIARDVNGFKKSIEFTPEQILGAGAEWRSVREDENLDFVPTIVNIADNICDYIPTEIPEKKKYTVTIHWEVAYVDTVEATDEDEAYETVKKRAQDAPSSDYQWLEEMDWEAREEKQ